MFVTGVTQLCESPVNISLITRFNYVSFMQEVQFAFTHTFYLPAVTCISELPAVTSLSLHPPHKVHYTTLILSHTVRDASHGFI